MTLEEAITQASDEAGLPVWYRDNLKPLLRDPEGYWPRCCDSGCEPCNAVLCSVAARTLKLMGTPRQEPLP